MKHDPNDILDAAVALFDSDGVGVSTAKVAKAAGVSNGTLFNYFPTKQALIDAVYVRLKNELVDAVGLPDPGADLRQQYEAIWMAWGDWATSHPERHRVAMLLRDAGLVSESVAADIDARHGGSKIFEDAVADGLFIDLPVSYLTSVIMAQFELAHRLELNADQRRVAFTAAWNGISTQRTEPNRSVNAGG